MRMLTPILGAMMLALAMSSVSDAQTGAPVATPASITPGQAICFGGIGVAATCVDASHPLPVTGGGSGGGGSSPSATVGGVAATTRSPGSGQVVSGNQAYAVGNEAPLNLTTTGRLKVGVSAATNVAPAAIPSTTLDADLVGCRYASAPGTWSDTWTGAVRCNSTGALSTGADDGALVSIGSKGDAPGNTTTSSLIAISKQIDNDTKAILTGPLNIGGSVSFGGNLPDFSNVQTFNLGTSPVLGTTADTAYTGTGSASLVSILKAEATAANQTTQITAAQTTATNTTTEVARLTTLAGVTGATGATAPTSALLAGYINGSGNLTGIGSSNPLPVAVISGGGGSGANVGTTGATSPTSANLQGYSNGSGNLTAVGTATPLPVTVISGGGSGSNAAAGTTGSAVPTQADFTGFSDGSGNMLGVSAANPLPTLATGPLAAGSTYGATKPVPVGGCTTVAAGACSAGTLNQMAVSATGAATVAGTVSLSLGGSAVYGGNPNNDTQAVTTYSLPVLGWTQVFDGTYWVRSRAVSTMGNSGVGIMGVGIEPNNVSASGVAPVATQAATSQVGKASAGNLYGFDVTEGATPGYFAILNLAAAPASGAPITPVACAYVLANDSKRYRQEIPDRLSAGVTMVSTTSCSTYTPNTPAMMAMSVE